MKNKFDIVKNIDWYAWGKDRNLGISPGRGRLWDSSAAATIWSIWHERNNRIFRNCVLSHQSFLQKCLQLYNFWTSASLQDLRDTGPDETQVQGHGDLARSVRRSL